ncbi:hypothetical protein [Exiguobacterium sp. s150]|uniref:hypothetical protein n=1 Tax=Exiguobacterium sp. s150 TaxID=2751221 RepID=UPI001BE9F91B|nr:hypothetical protein [Exiguobacterium sp. s150]
MNTIIERFVSIQEVMDALCLQVTNYNWLVTDLDAVISNDSLKYFEEIQELEEGAAYWIKGERLLELVQHTNLYVIWGVFTAFERKTSITLNDLIVHPFADGNSDLWIESPRVQHPDAMCELIFWDSTFVLMLSQVEDVSERFRQTFPGWRSLEEYNRTEGLFESE